MSQRYFRRCGFSLLTLTPKQWGKCLAGQLRWFEPVRRCIFWMESNMKFNDLRVAHKLWLVMLGLLVLVLIVAFWTQRRSVHAAELAEAQVQKFDASIATAIRWRGLAELAVTLSQANAVTSDEALKKEFGDRIAGLTARITPVQQQITKDAITQADKDCPGPCGGGPCRTSRRSGGRNLQKAGCCG